jgi:hypothetical protein
MSDPKFKLTPHPGVLGEASEWIRSMWQYPDPNFSTYRLIGLLKSFKPTCEVDRTAMEFIINFTILYKLLSSISQ